QERIDELASAFEDVLDAAAADDVDVDLEDVDPTDDPDAAAQAVIDAQTADLRQEIAEFEAELASYETSDDAVDQRAQELAGRPASELRAMRNERAYEQVQVEQRQQTRGAAAAQTDTTGRSDATGGQTDTDADAMALSAMDGADRLQALDSDQSPVDRFAWTTAAPSTSPTPASCNSSWCCANRTPVDPR
ncbi:MAG: hypothetical protein SVU32_00910, partial [Candidatus Nanohaloarchaea archaeon]|nr:hypothetical protein [Candidatus Nanohaloarchaea archaeon]